MDEEVVRRRDVDRLSFTAWDQHVSARDGDSTEGFDAPRRTEEPGDGVEDVDPGVERRPHRGAVEDRRVTLVLAPRRGTHVRHLPNRQRRAAQPA